MTQPMFAACSDCPVAGGACFARRSNNARLCALPQYRPMLAAWGDCGGPAVAPHGDGPIPPEPIPPSDWAGPVIDEWEFVTVERLCRDTRSLIAALPPDIDLVAAISRSGLLPGSLAAFHLHLPLWTVSRQTGVLDPGHGGRMDGRESPPPRHVLLIDDTAARGSEMHHCGAIARAKWPDARITRAVVYAHPQAHGAADLFHASYPGLHYLEWNWSNAGHSVGCGYDWDGILSPDFAPEQCRDMDAYRSAMAAMPPLFLPRRAPIHTIVTGRPESCRDVSTEWLARWGVKVERLVMWPGSPHPAAGDVAPWKAKHYAESDLTLFAESDPEQAAIISEITGKAVLCPAAGRVFPPRPKAASTGRVPLAENLRLHALVNACPERGCREGCQKTRCNRDDRPVYLSDCVACVSNTGA